MHYIAELEAILDGRPFEAWEIEPQRLTVWGHIVAFWRDLATAE